MPISRIQTGTAFTTGHCRLPAGQGWFWKKMCGIGDSAIVCKGVTIGKNSIIGAGAVVTCDIPANVVAAGNPARVIRKLDPAREIITRKDRYGDTEKMTMVLENVEKDCLEGNTFLGWIRSLIAPAKD